MLTANKPKSKTLTPVYLNDLLTKTKDLNVYVIENTMQREFVWSYKDIETLWYDIIQCIESNIDDKGKDLVGSRVFSKKYLDLGSIEISSIDKCNMHYLTHVEGVKYHSLVDGSQRNRLSMFIIIAFLYEMAKINKYDKVDLSHLKIYDNVFKLIEIGNNKLHNFYQKIENSSVSQLSTEIKCKDKLFKKFEKDNFERDYFYTFSLMVDLIEESIIGRFDLGDCLNIFLNNVVFTIEEIDTEYKFSRFVDRNKKGTPMSDESMYPKLLINNFNETEKTDVYNAFKEFKDLAFKTQYTDKKGEPATFKPTKSKVDSLLFIMIESLKIRLGEWYFLDETINLKKIFTSTFDLGNIDYGIDKCFTKHIVFNTANDAISYFKECKRMSDFLLYDSFSNTGDLSSDFYYFRDFNGGKNVMWWYFIKPCYLIKTRYQDENDDRYKYIKDKLFALYCFYVVHRASDTNSQNLINLLEKISCFLIVNKNTDEISFKQKLNDIIKQYIDNSNGYEGIKQQVERLSIDFASNRNPIICVLISLEYFLCKKYGICTDDFFRLWKRSNSSFNIDHWLPENVFKDEINKSEYQQIGNLVLLEGSLNKSKQDNTYLNSDYYTQSKINQTLLMNKDNRGTYSNSILDKINSDGIVYRVNKEMLNNPSLDLIRDRTKFYADFFVNFIRESIEK